MTCYERAKTLTRDEMKNVMAGDKEDPQFQNGLCLYCWTPGGFESWCRTDTGSNPEGLCEGIYEAYDASEVTGNWQTGGTDCSDC